MKRYQFDDATKAALEKMRVPLAVYQFIDKRVVTIVLSDGFCELFGFDDKARAYYVMDNDMYEAAHPDDVARIANEAFRFATQGGKYDVVYRTKTAKSDEYKIVHSIGEHVFTGDGVRLAYVWYTDEGNYTTSVEKNRRLLNAKLAGALHEESLMQASRYDFLTGLPSMSYFFELADAGRKSMLSKGTTMALLYMDLCGMKFFNRKYGFAEGDRLLQRFANLLKKYFSNENCSRFGSDHFCVFAGTERLEDKLREIFDVLSDPANGRSLPVRVGICLDSDGVPDISSDCDRAKFACDTMRNIYLSRFCYFNETMLAKAHLTQYIVSNIDKAIARGWIQVHFQPIIRTANGRVCHEEALARWIDPVKGMLRPSEFIPVLEEANLIQKLDLFVAEKVLEKINRQRAEGLTVVPQSVNLSRADFSACDIVEEICRRTDAAGVDRALLNIEITESAIGSDFAFMKEQIDRFRSLGFRVWMDDFGSGYSSLDVLQSLRFDMIKFDMHFVKELDGSVKNRILLTELIKMALALGIDAVCEGVETKEQADFLREVGCAMLQGFYFGRPMAFETILGHYRKGLDIGFENPDEAEYYAAIGKINLYDLSFISSEDQEAFAHYFNTIPMAIMETNGDKFRLMRCNTSFRVFLEKMFGVTDMGHWTDHASEEGRVGEGFIKAIRDCGKSDNMILFDEELKGGAVAHTFIKQIAQNPVNGTKALAVVVLAVMNSKQTQMTFSQVAKALSSDYDSLYYVNLSTEAFIEYRSEGFAGELEVERSGRDFFQKARTGALRPIFSEDLEMFVSSFTKENVTQDIDESGSFTLTYRLVKDGAPVYVSMKAVRANADSGHIIIGVNNVDAQMRQSEAMEQMKREQETQMLISALAGTFLCIYTVDPDTGHYRVFNAAGSYDALELPQVGEDFFGDSLETVMSFICPADREMFRAAWSEDYILHEIRENGFFLMTCRMMSADKSVYVSAKAVLADENGGQKLIIGLKKSGALVKRGLSAL